MIMFSPTRKCKYEKCPYPDHEIEKSYHEYVVLKKRKFYHLECYKKMDLRRRLGVDDKNG